MRKEAERAHKASEALRRQSNGIAAGGLALRRKEFEYKQKNGGSSGKAPTSLRGVNGFYSKKMDSNEMNSFYNQTYNEMKKRGYINEGKLLANLPSDVFGNKSLSQSAIKQAVDNALMEHPEVGDWLAEEFEFDFDPRYGNNGTPALPQQGTYLGYTPDWRGGKSLGIGVGSQTNNNGMKLGLGL